MFHVIGRTFQITALLEKRMILDSWLLTYKQISFFFSFNIFEIKRCNGKWPQYQEVPNIKLLMCWRSIPYQLIGQKQSFIHPHKIKISMVLEVLIYHNLSQRKFRMLQHPPVWTMVGLTKYKHAGMHGQCFQWPT